MKPDKTGTQKIPAFCRVILKDLDPNFLIKMNHNGIAQSTISNRIQLTINQRSRVCLDRMIFSVLFRIIIFIYTRNTTLLFLLNSVYKNCIIIHCNFILSRVSCNLGPFKALSQRRAILIIHREKQKI